MKLQLFLTRAAIGAGALILAIGLAVAQTAPAPAGGGAPVDRKAARDSCRSEISADLKGKDRREAMQACMSRKGATGPQLTEAERERIKDLREANRKAVKEARKTCRDELKNQKLTEDERRTGIEDCIAKGNPQFAKMITCRRDADSKKLEKGSSPFREHMRSCMRGA